jgi:hypothetical protein
MKRENVSAALAAGHASKVPINKAYAHARVLFTAAFVYRTGDRRPFPANGALH